MILLHPASHVSRTFSPATSGVLLIQWAQCRLCWVNSSGEKSIFTGKWLFKAPAITWKPSNHSSSCPLTTFHVFDTIFSFCKPSGTSIIVLTQGLEAHFAMCLLTMRCILTDGGVLLSSLPFPTGSLCEGSSVPPAPLPSLPHQGTLSHCPGVFCPRSGGHCSFHLHVSQVCLLCAWVS